MNEVTICCLHSQRVTKLPDLGLQALELLLQCPAHNTIQTLVSPRTTLYGNNYGQDVVWEGTHGSASCE